MIKLFRKIRQKLIEQNKVRNYFLYAVGEIILVVIGILIALQINNWNENNKLEKQTYKVLLQMQDDFSINQNELQLKIEQHKFTKASLDELSNLVGPNPKEIEPNRLDSLMFSMIFLPEFNAATAIASSDKLALVDDELKNYIADWKLNYDYYKYTIKLISENTTLSSQFLVENYQYKNFKNELLEPNISAFESDRHKILSNHLFENYVYLRSINASFLVKRATTLHEIQDKILQHIALKLSNYD